MFSKEVAPHPKRGVGGNSHVADQKKNTKYGLLETRYVAQIDCIQTCICHGTCTKENCVDIAELELYLGITTVAIDAAAVHDNR